MTKKGPLIPFSGQSTRPTSGAAEDGMARSSACEISSARVGSSERSGQRRLAGPRLSVGPTLTNSWGPRRAAGAPPEAGDALDCSGVGAVGTWAASAGQKG